MVAKENKSLDIAYQDSVAGKTFGTSSLYSVFRPNFGLTKTSVELLSWEEGRVLEYDAM
jgi:hypothetical protein